MRKDSLICIFLVILIPAIISGQEFPLQNDSKEQQINYRRTETNQPPTTYTQQPKEQVFPLGYATNHLGKVATGTGVWTELNPNVPRVNYIGIDFINPDTGWACGGSGAIIKTTNGGDDWTISETPINNLLLKIHSYNGQVVIATGYDGLILRSSDGGETFEQVPSGVGSGTDLWGVQVLNDTLGWVCGMNQTLLKTTDAGETWQQIFPSLNQHYWSLDFLSELYGMIACGGGLVLKTTDGGISWQQYQAGDTRALYTVDIIDSLHIAAAGAGGKNVYSSDGGVTWVTNPDLPAIQGTNWIEFIDRDTGYSVQDVWQMRKTTNRGQNWFNPNTTNLGGEWQVELIIDGTGYSCGDALSIYKRTNGLDNWEELFLNDDLVDIHFTNDLTGYFVGGTELGGPVYKTNDGGISFVPLENFPSDEFDLLRCITFTDSLIAFVGGYKSKIAKTTNAGLNWNLVNITGLTDTIGAIVQIFFINKNVGWAVTTRGGITNTTDGGDNWVAQLNVPTGIFSSVYFIDSLYGWATIFNRRPYKTTDGGQNWIEQTNLNLWHTSDVYFTNVDTGWIINTTSGRVLYKTTDSGIGWFVVPEVLGAYKFHFFPDPHHWLINGTQRYITEDGGNTWINITNDVPTEFTSFGAVTDKFGYAAGETGLILRYDDTTYIPVELVSFSGKIESNIVILEWITASELNNYGFEIQRLNDNNHWEKVGFVPGKGTSSEYNSYNYEDSHINNDKNYYRLKQIDFNGTFEYSNTLEVTIPLSSFYLYQNFPNPFNPVTTIKYDLPNAGNVELVVYDILGRKVKELVNQTQQPGRYDIQFDASTLASGVYIYQLSTKDFVNSKKMILLK
jgi:photosystem II stability/assembly factor-like uncharacterized protein